MTETYYLKVSAKEFEYLKAIIAVIKEKEIIDALLKEGYVVKEQGKMRAF